MGTPRPTLRLVGDAGSPRLVTGRDGVDWTEAVQAFSEQAITKLKELDLCGFVLKSASPSCGLERVKVYDEPRKEDSEGKGKKRRGSSPARKAGVGIFARTLLEAFPNLPIEEEGRLRDAQLREAFLDAVFAYARWRNHCEQPADSAQLIRFHQRNKYLLRVHSPHHTRQLGRLVADAGQNPSHTRKRYGDLFMHALKTRATTRKHADAMRHMTGHLRRRISPQARRLLHERIDDYASGITARDVPVTLLRHHALEHQITYLSEQSYLDPYPKALGRN